MSDLDRLKGSQLRVGMVLGAGLHLGVRPCQTEGITAQGGNIAGYRATPGCQTLSECRGDSSVWEYCWVPGVDLGNPGVRPCLSEGVTAQGGIIAG